MFQTRFSTNIEVKICQMV